MWERGSNHEKVATIQAVSCVYLYWYYITINTGVACFSGSATNTVNGGLTMNPKRKGESNRGENVDKKREKVETEEKSIVSEELIRWMTESTHPYLTPRSDGG